jgi:glutamyl-Q tRNA(Asp) synthetase
VRIEDIDTQRAVPGMADNILRTLETWGFEWDGEVVYQSARTDLYAQALASLVEHGHVFDCSCTRAEIEAYARAPHIKEAELRYPGLCRSGPLYPDRSMAVRFRVPDHPISFVDQLQGTVTVDLVNSIGDFVIKRRDGLFAYQLAVVVDDHAQGITEVVRGADLLYNTPRQIALQSALGYETPLYVHLPIATDAKGCKLSKSAAAAGVDANRPTSMLWQVLHFLNQAPPAELKEAGVLELWAWAKTHWETAVLAGIQAKPAVAAVGHCTTNALL